MRDADHKYDSARFCSSIIMSIACNINLAFDMRYLQQPNRL